MREAIIGRLRRLEQRVIPPNNVADSHAAEFLGDRRRRRLEAAGLLFDDPPQYPFLLRLGRTRGVNTAPDSGRLTPEPPRCRGQLRPSLGHCAGAGPTAYRGGKAFEGEGHWSVAQHRGPYSCR